MRAPLCGRWKRCGFYRPCPVDLSALDLEAVLPNVGDEHIETVVLSPVPAARCAAMPICRTTVSRFASRVRDARVELRSLLDETMHRTGARSELEAIVTGLRSLRAPSPDRWSRVCPGSSDEQCVTPSLD
ncbi:MAG: hypothetical protein IPK92_14700 [Nitrospira sp.]|nr:hypothetical protein [Nitrospira sp.]